MKKDKLPLVTAVSSFDAVVSYAMEIIPLMLWRCRYCSMPNIWCAAMVQVCITFCMAGHLMLLWEMAIRCLMTS